MQRTIIKMLLEKDNQFKIDENTLSFFDNQFNMWYKAIETARELGYEINMENVVLAAIYKDLPLQPDYPKDTEPFVNTIEKAVDLHIRKVQEERLVSNIDTLLKEYQRTKDKDILEKINNLTKIKRNVKSNVVPIENYKDEQNAFIDRILEGKPPEGVLLYKYGNTQQFERLSKVLHVIAPSDLVIIAGRPSVGKTSFALALANVFSKNGYRGLFFSLEMTNAQLLDRLTMSKSGIPKDRLLNREDTSATKYYKQALDEIAKLPIMVVDDIPRTWLEMKQLIIENKDNIDYVIVDYLGLISSYDGKDYGQQAYVVVTNISRDMKLLAREIGKPMIVLAQFNRNVGSQQKGPRDDAKYAEPFAHDLRDSGSIEQDADKMIFLYRHNDKKEDREILEKQGKYNVNVKVEKNRGGSTKILKYEFNGVLQRWKEKEDEK